MEHIFDLFVHLFSVYIYIHIYIYRERDREKAICSYIHLSLSLYICTYTLICIYIVVLIYVCVCVYIYICVCIVGIYISIYESNLPAARFRSGPIGDGGMRRSGCLILFFGCFAEIVSVDALPFVRKGTRWVGEGMVLNLI